LPQLKSPSAAGHDNDPPTCTSRSRLQVTVGCWTRRTIHPRALRGQDCKSPSAAGLGERSTHVHFEVNTESHRRLLDSADDPPTCTFKVKTQHPAGSCSETTSHKQLNIQLGIVRNNFKHTHTSNLHHCCEVTVRNCAEQFHTHTSNLRRCCGVSTPSEKLCGTISHTSSALKAGAFKNNFPAWSRKLTKTFTTAVKSRVRTHQHQALSKPALPTKSIFLPGAEKSSSPTVH
jgi:hypothetical protein